MASVRISTNWNHPHEMRWVGAPDIDNSGRIERTLPIPEEAYQAIESAISGGPIEGDVYLPDSSRFHWFLDR